MSIALCIIAFVISFVAGRSSRLAGLVTTLAIGYAYGIVRANVPETLSHFIFDSAVLGFYLTQFGHRFAPLERIRIRKLKPWVEILMVWPIIMAFIPLQDWLVRVVGLRGNIFMLPFLFVGACLERDERYKLALWLAGFNIIAFAFALVQFFVGVEPFFPKSEVTLLIYNSKDLAGGAYRIPSFFNNSHAYAGTIAATLPFLLGALVYRQKTGWALRLLVFALPATLLGIFMAAARLPVIIAGIIIPVASFSLRKRGAYAVAWLVILAVVAWIVSSDERLQRFTSLRDPEVVTERLSGSVNMGFIELAQAYPFGNGLGGGTSMPYWLKREIQRPVAVENEYARIMLEQGLLGLFFWVGFLLWATTRYFYDPAEKWDTGRKLALVFCVAQFLASIVGTGTFISIPGSCLLLLLMGWITSSEASTSEAALPRFRFAFPDPNATPVVNERPL